MMSRALAPSAMRTPISRERDVTVNASSPWMPMAASRKATAANAPSTRSCTTRGAVSSDDDLFERPHVGDRQLRIGLPDDRAHGRHQRRRRHGGAHDQILRRIEPSNGHRAAATRPGRPAARCCRARGRGSGCRQRRRRWSCTAPREPERSADRILSGKMLPRKRLADDGHGRRVERIRVALMSRPLQNRHADRLEVARRDESHAALACTSGGAANPPRLVGSGVVVRTSHMPPRIVNGVKLM